MVLAIVLWSKQICDINIAILFLMLALEMTMIVLKFDSISLKFLSSLWKWAFLIFLSLQFTIWKEKWSGKLSTSLKPEESSL